METCCATDEYQTLMKKFWVAAILAVPILATMLIEMIPSLRDVTMARRQTIGIAASILSFLVLAYSGGQFFSGAWNNFRNHNANMDTLVALGTGAAWLYSTVAVITPSFFPAGTARMFFDVPVIVTALIVLGQALEMRAKSRSSAAIKKLMELQAKTACVIREGKEKNIPIDELVIGDTVLVRPGEKVPVDGVILKGESTVDESFVTGESLPIDKKPGDLVIGSSINKTGAFTFRATKVGKDTVLAQIVEMVRQAQSSKAPIAKVVDVVASYFVPVVMIIAVITFLAWFNFGPPPAINFAVITMVTVLVIACPCALGLATPMSLTVGIGKAAENGVLIRNGKALETASRLTTIVLDKTGTITKGKPELTNILPLGNFSRENLLYLAASADKLSEHPLAEAIVKGARDRRLDVGEPENFEAIPGHGAEATVMGQHVLVGNLKFMQQALVWTAELEAAADRLASEGKTPVFVAIDRKAAGVIGVADTPREDSFTIVQTLQRMGIEVIMITGDNERTAQVIANRVGIKRVIAEASPQDKARHIKKLREENQSSKKKIKLIGMVGDGINDAPALARADVGFAIASGTDIAMEAADITLMGGLRGVVYAIEISKATLRNIKQNLFGAFIYNILGIPIAAGIFYPLLKMLLSPIIAGGAMAASSVTVVSNANRLRFFRPTLVGEVQ